MTFRKSKPTKKPVRPAKRERPGSDVESGAGSDGERDDESNGERDAGPAQPPAPPIKKARKGPAPRIEADIEDLPEDLPEDTPPKRAAKKAAKLQPKKAAKRAPPDAELAVPPPSPKQARKKGNASPSPVKAKSPRKAKAAPAPRPRIVVDETHTTTQLLADKELDETRFIITQFGGLTLNTAGDAALYAARGRNGAAAFVDVGSKSGIQNKRLKNAAQAVLKSRDLEMALDEAASSEDEWESKLREMPEDELRILGLITHSHKDHASGDLPIKAANLSALRVGQSGAGTWQASKVDAGRKKQPITAPIEENRERVFSFREGGKTRREGQPMRMTSRALLPDTDEDETDENAMSLGVVTKVERGGADDGERIFTMYSLGDMTPDAAQARIAQAFQEDGATPADVVKMAHHGSDHNIEALPPAVTDENTIVLFSGFTGLSGKRFDQFLAKDGYNWKTGYILYANKQTAEDMKTTELGKRLLRSGFRFAQDYVVRVTKSGQVEHFATEWPG